MNEAKLKKLIDETPHVKYVYNYRGEVEEYQMTIHSINFLLSLVKEHERGKNTDSKRN